MEIAEYQPQILQAKLAIVGGVAFAGSANFDARSAQLNYEIRIGIADAGLAREGWALFEADWLRSRSIRRQMENLT